MSVIYSSENLEIRELLTETKEERDFREKMERGGGDDQDTESDNDDNLPLPSSQPILSNSPINANPSKEIIFLYYSLIYNLIVDCNCNYHTEMRIKLYKGFRYQIRYEIDTTFSKILDKFSIFTGFSDLQTNHNSEQVTEADNYFGDSENGGGGDEELDLALLKRLKRKVNAYFNLSNRYDSLPDPYE